VVPELPAHAVRCTPPAPSPADLEVVPEVPAHAPDLLPAVAPASLPVPVSEPALAALAAHL
jgi:hypothetical protein